PSEPLAPAHHHHDHHGHSHGLVDPSIVLSRSGIRSVSWSLAILTVTALAQAFIYSQTLSVALLADLIHNFGDALTAIPLGLAFFLRSLRGERLAGLAVVLAIVISALVALGQTIERFIHRRALTHLWLLAAAGLIGFRDARPTSHSLTSPGQHDSASNKVARAPKAPRYHHFKRGNHARGMSNHAVSDRLKPA